MSEGLDTLLCAATMSASTEENKKTKKLKELARILCDEIPQTDCQFDAFLDIHNIVEDIPKILESIMCDVWVDNKNFQNEGHIKNILNSIDSVTGDFALTKNQELMKELLGYLNMFFISYKFRVKADLYTILLTISNIMDISARTSILEKDKSISICRNLKDMCCNMKDEWQEEQGIPLMVFSALKLIGSSFDIDTYIAMMYTGIE